MRLLLRLLATAAALAVATLLLHGITLTAPTTGRKVFAMLVVAVIFGVLNALVKPIFTFVTAPLVLITLGLFLIVINACMLLLTSWVAGKVDLGWHVDGFLTALFGSLIVSVVTFVLSAFVPDRDDNPRGRRVSGRDEPVRVVFLCWGNICRSPMAERVAERWAADEGVDGVVFTSAATSTEELGSPIDRRAAAVLRERGYRAGDHSAHQITAAEVAGADLVIAMEDIHVSKLTAIAPGASNVGLLTDYDPAAEPGSGVPDPWYGTPAGFYGTLEAVEAAMPGVLSRVRELRARSRRT